MIKYLFCLYLLIFIILYFTDNIYTIEGNVNREQLYNNLMNNFKNIFPDGNRNSGGAQFFNYIMNLNPTKEEFDNYNTFYCAVSGSPISYDRKDNKSFIYIEDLNGNKICGDYYRCCVPCNCDLMKYSKIEKMNLSLKDGNFDYYVITINDPCSNQKSIPKSVTSFKCKNNKTLNGKFSPSGRLIRDFT